MEKKEQEKVSGLESKVNEIKKSAGAVLGRGLLYGGAAAMVAYPIVKGVVDCVNNKFEDPFTSSSFLVGQLGYYSLYSSYLLSLKEADDLDLMDAVPIMGLAAISPIGLFSTIPYLLAYGVTKLVYH